MARRRWWQGALYPGIRAGLALLSLLPWRARSAAAGAIGRTIIRLSPPLSARVNANLAHVMPQAGADERRRIARGVGTCFGRTALELFDSRAFAAARPWGEPTGEGVAAIEAALASGTGAVVVSGHYGGWDAIRAWLKERGAPCATVYRKLDDPRLEAFYRRSIAFTGAPVLPKDRSAARGLVQHLRRGGFVTLLVDQHQRRAPSLDFLGRPAPTMTIPAEMALRFGVPFVPAFATRRGNGHLIDIRFAAPVPHTDGATMMQAVNDALADEVRAHPEQYYWLHRRWSKTLPGFAG